MVVTVEKDPNPMYSTKPWVIKVDGRILAWNYRTKKDAVANVEASGNVVLNKKG